MGYLEVQFSHSAVSHSLRPHGRQYARLPCPSPTPGAYSDSCPSSQWCHPTISSSDASFSFWPQSFPASGSFPLSWLFDSGADSIGTSASALPMNIKDYLPEYRLVWSPCCPRNSQESSLAPQFESINFLVLSLYGPTLTSIHDYWKNHSFEYMDLCQESNIPAF